MALVVKVASSKEKKKLDLMMMYGGFQKSCLKVMLFKLISYFGV